MREVLQVNLENAKLIGTLHQNENSVDNDNKPGILLLSFGQQPRSWVGDLGTGIADRIAECGYTVFRFDMPGLGDSPGELPVHLEILWREIQLGAHEPYLHELCKKLLKEFNIDGLIVGGFCGGAVTAAFAVNDCDIDLRGLILIEPEFSLAEIEMQQKQSSVSRDLPIRSYLARKQLLTEKIFSVKAWKKLITGKSDFKFWINFIRNVFGRFYTKVSKKKVLPAEANLKFYDAWRTARKRSIPTLILSLGSDIRTTYYKEYGVYPGVDNPSTKLTWTEIPNTTHAMLAGGAKESVILQIAEWVKKF